MLAAAVLVAFLGAIVDDWYEVGGLSMSFRMVWNARYVPVVGGGNTRGEFAGADGGEGKSGRRPDLIVSPKAVESQGERAAATPYNTPKHNAIAMIGDSLPI